MDFVILRKNFGGRIVNRYFRNWEKAKAEMDKDVKDCCESLGGKVKKKYDYMNRDKGFYVYETTAHFPAHHEDCTWAIIDGYFEDE